MTDKEQNQCQEKYDKLGEFVRTEVEKTGKGGDEFVAETVQWARAMVRGAALLYAHMYNLGDQGVDELDQELMATIIDWTEEKEQTRIEEEKKSTQGYRFSLKDFMD